MLVKYTDLDMAIHYRYTLAIMFDNTMANRKRRKGQKDKQRSTNHTYTTKDRVTRTPLKIEGELRSPGYHS
jgi:hypothetical protein